MSEALYELLIAADSTDQARPRLALDSRAMNRSTGNTDKAPDFEQSLQELEALIAKLERGELPLAESLALFEQGVALTRRCHTSLAEARQRVEILLQSGGTAPFAPESQGDD
jgi:exodeoxyribonuclease VII small subunit